MDEELLMVIPFTANVKLKSIGLYGPGDSIENPTKMHA
jgi:hypothetical protein